MNGAEALIQTLCDAGVDVCFANPGTSEMQLVAALDGQPKMRAVLGLFEGVVTGAADGYGRMADKPAATLLHLGPGLGNGLANLHNAKRAFTPVVNIVGDHAGYHLKFDAPLTSDVVGVAKPMSDWVYTSKSADDLAISGANAVAKSMSYPGKIATLITPADHAWTEGASVAAPVTPPKPKRTSGKLVKDAAKALSGDGPHAIYLGGRALREETLELAGKIAAKTGARILCEFFAARLQRGAGRVPVERIPYFGEMAQEFLKDFKSIVFIGSKPPVSFFAYPGKDGWLSPEGANLVSLADQRTDAHNALSRLVKALDAQDTDAAAQPAFVPPAEPGQLNPFNLGAVIAELMPEDCIVSDEANTAGLGLFPMTVGAPKHDWLMQTGGSIGQGLPVAVGAACACPERKVLALQADGSAMYTVQALWTMARENLDVTTVIINNGSYAILNVELKRVGVQNPGPVALSLLDLTRPEIDWVKVSEGQGVPAVKVTTTEELREALTDALSVKGPRLIEAMVDMGALLAAA